jgi:hypothetical protein
VSESPEEFESHEARALAVVRRRAPGLIVVLLVAGAPAAFALLITALLACPLMMLIMFGTAHGSSASHPQTGHQPTPASFPPGQMPVDKERSLR